MVEETRNHMVATLGFGCLALENAATLKFLLKCQSVALTVETRVIF